MNNRAGSQSTNPCAWLVIKVVWKQNGNRQTYWLLPCPTSRLQTASCWPESIKYYRLRQVKPCQLQSTLGISGLSTVHNPFIRVSCGEYASCSMILQMCSSMVATMIIPQYIDYSRHFWSQGLQRHPQWRQAFPSLVSELVGLQASTDRDLGQLVKTMWGSTFLNAVCPQSKEKPRVLLYLFKFLCECVAFSMVWAEFIF